MIYLETHSTDPSYNLAFEEYVLRSRMAGDYLILWQNDKTVVVGQNQNAAAEIDRAFVDSHGIRVVRRATGGGAVYHDLGNLNFSFITDIAGSVAAAREKLTIPVTDALRGLGLDAALSGRNDILVSGCKVSGTAQRIYNRRILHHGTLLFDSDLSMVAGALRPDPEKFRSHGAKSVASRVGNIRDSLPRDMTLADFWLYLKTALARDGLVPGTLTEEELGAVTRLKAEKYDTWEWTYGRSPQYTFRNRRKWPGGILEALVQVEHGRITSIAFQGDFLSSVPLDALTDSLTGAVFSREDVSPLLARDDISAFLGEIAPTQVLETLFPEQAEPE